MPTYVYGCDMCGHRFEALQKFSDAPLTTCPECSAQIRRIFQPAGIVFKGSGWYSTDSRGGGASRSSDTTSSSTGSTTKDTATSTSGSTPAASQAPAASASDAAAS